MREVERYHKRVSGPILDRIDLHVEVPVVDLEELSSQYDSVSRGEASSLIRRRVCAARLVQRERFSGQELYANAEMKNKHLTKFCKLGAGVKAILTKGAAKFGLSARSYFKVIKIARTIADLSHSEEITVDHVAEALQYRPRVKEE